MTRQAIALIFLGLICSSLATDAANAIPVATQWNPKQPREILSQIASRIASDGPLDDIWGLFTSLTNTIRKEQSKHDSLSDRQKKECKLERTFRRKEVADAQSALSRASGEKKTCESALRQNTESLEFNQKTQGETSTSIQILDDARKRDADHHKTKIGNLNAALSAIDEGEKILGELFNGQASLVELSSATVKMFTGAVDLGITEMYVPVIAALAQVAQKSELLIDQNVVKKIQDLINQLRKSIQNRLQKSEANEAKAISAYQTNRDKLAKQLADLKESEKTLKENIANYNQCILKAENIIILATTKRDRNAALLGDADKMCKTFEAEYKEGTEQRKQELALLAKMEGIVRKRLGGVSKDVSQRASQEKGEWAKHENVAVLKGPAAPPKKGSKNYSKAELEKMAGGN